MPAYLASLLEFDCVGSAATDVNDMEFAFFRYTSEGVNI